MVIFDERRILCYDRGVKSIRERHMQTEIVLVRHGQSMGNLVRRFLGHTDLDITELGYQQAEQVALALAQQAKPDAIISSDLLRAFHTAEAIAKKWDMTVQLELGLREIYAGEWEGLPFDEIKSKYADSYNRFCFDMGLAHPDGGESCAALRTRAKKTLDRIVTQHKGGRLVLVSHAALICMLCSDILGLSLEEVPKLGLCENASITTIVHDENGYRLVTYGDPSHLGEYRTKRPPLS